MEETRERLAKGRRGEGQFEGPKEAGSRENPARAGLVARRFRNKRELLPPGGGGGFVEGVQRSRSVGDG